jgi:hypothetical protein
LTAVMGQRQMRRRDKENRMQPAGIGLTRK